MKFLVDDVKGMFGFVECVFRRFKGVERVEIRCADGEGEEFKGRR